MKILQSPLRTPRQSAQEYGRGLAGGLIFSLPLLFTMEVWQAGWTIHPQRLALYIVATGAILVLYNRFAGLRDQSTSWWECIIDSVEEMGLGLALAAFMLWLTGRFDGPISALEIGGQIVMGGMTVAIGVSVGTAQLGTGGSSDDSKDKLNDDSDEKNNASKTSGESKKESENYGYLSQMALAFCGAVLIAASIAPTEEVLIVATKVSTFKLIFIALFSIALATNIQFFAAFRGTVPRQEALSWGEALFLIISTYAVALLAAALTLFFFGRFDGESPAICVAQTIVVGLAASLGASAGRLLLQGNESGN